MTNEFGETPAYYVWPAEQIEGEPYGDGFHARLTRALATENLEWESV